MNMPYFPMSITDWTTLEATHHQGETGFALWRTRKFGDIRVRLVEYSAGYQADHWCSKGHVLFCVAGSLEVEIRGGDCFALRPNQSYHVGDGDPPHRSHTNEGATLFIVD
jgi:hypothetical protein